MKKTTTKKPKIKKTIKSVSSKLGLMLEGTVYLVEYDKQGKVAYKVALDNDTVLQALSIILLQSAKKKP